MWVADLDESRIYPYYAGTLGPVFHARVPYKHFKTLEAAGNDSPLGIWSDGVTMWVADPEDNKIYAYYLATKERVPNKDFETLGAAGNTYPSDIWSDEVTMWVADFEDAKIYAYDLATKERVPNKDFETLAAAGNGSPVGIWSDGVTMWVMDYEDKKNLRLPHAGIRRAHRAAQACCRYRRLQAESFGGLRWAEGRRQPSTARHLVRRGDDVGDGHGLRQYLRLRHDDQRAGPRLYPEGRRQQ